MSLRRLWTSVRSPLLLSVILCLFACTHAPPVPDPSPVAQPAPPPSFGELSAPPAGPATPATGRIAAERFPALLAGLPRLETIDYEAQGHAGLGYSISYGDRESLVVTLYVYDMGLAGIPDGASSPQVKDQLRRAVGDILQAEQMGLYKNVQKLRETTVTLGSGAPGPGLQASGLVFRLDIQGESKTSHVYASGYRGTFVKLRCTYAHDAQTEPQSEEALRRFLTALGPVLSS